MNFANATPWTLGLIGLLLGMRHATDADHVVAVTTILTRERRLGAAARIGFAWGLGHTMTVVAVGIAIIGFEWKIPPRLGLGMELVVALVLIILGFTTLASSGWGANTHLVHSHPHLHDGESHQHPHAHLASEGPSGMRHIDHLLPIPPVHQSFPGIKAFVVGLAHGLAGSAAIALLILSTIPNGAWQFAYLILFGLGTLLGMTLITGAIGLPVVLYSSRIRGLQTTLTLGAGAVSTAFGTFLVYQIIVVGQFFGTVVHWTPK